MIAPTIYDRNLPTANFCLNVPPVAEHFTRAANITLRSKISHFVYGEIYHCNAVALPYHPCSVLLMMSSCSERERVVKSAL